MFLEQVTTLPGRSEESLTVTTSCRLQLQLSHEAIPLLLYLPV